MSLPRRWRAHAEIDLSPGVPDLSAFPRAAWLRAERAVLAHADIVAAKHASDLGTPALPQLVLAHMIAAGDFEHHIRLVRNRQRRRRDALLAGLREHLPGARIQGIPAGLHLLVTLPGLAGRLDDTDLARRMQQSGVLAHALSWHRERAGPPGLVLGYAAHTPDELREAARRIARAVRDLSP